MPLVVTRDVVGWEREGWGVGNSGLGPAWKEDRKQIS